MIQEWITTLSAAISLLSIAIASLIGVFQYRLKVKAEERLQESNKAEVDVRLSKLFTEIMWIAHSRAGRHVSEKCIEELFEKGIITKDDFGDMNALQEKLSICSMNLPVGIASQNAAIASIGVLGRRYEVLREPAKAALISLISFKEKEAKEALILLEGKNK